VYSSKDEAGEEEELKQENRKAIKEKPLIYLKDVNARHLLDEGNETTAQTGRGSKYDRIAYGGEQKKGLEALLEAQKELIGDDDDDDDLFQVKPKVGAGADRHKKLGAQGFDPWSSETRREGR
jgi:protein KRI1